MCLALASVVLLAACRSQPSAVANPTPSSSRTQPVVTGLFPDLPRAISPRPAGACYSESEMRAEEMVRLRTQMMLAGLTCRGAFRSMPDPFAGYQAFIVTQQAAIRDAQSTLGALLSRYRGGSPGRLYDTFQTQLANNEQRQLVAHGANNFCFGFEDKFNQASRFSPAELSSYLEQAVTRYRGDYPAC